jgi:DNA-binding transcriptional MocR family regulator
VSPVTVSRALGLLAAEGVVVVRPGAGTFVAQRARPAGDEQGDTGWQSVPLGDRVVDASRLSVLLSPAPQGVISLGSGYVHPELMPTRALAAAFNRAIRKADVWERPPTAGLQRLRLWFANAVGGSVAADDVLVTNGGQAALSAAFRALLPPGSALLVESPTYLGALAVARAAGLRPVPVPLDRGGLQMEQLADAFAATAARAVYCQPTFQNPTGTTLSHERRTQLLEVAAAAGAFVIEDDFARWISDERAPVPLVSSDKEGRVVHVASLTKATSPNLRIGALIARGPVAERLRSIRMVDDFFTSRLLQEGALELVGNPSWRRHLAALSAALAARREALVRALESHAPEVRVTFVPEGGMHLWVRLPDGVDDTAVALAAERAGVLVTPGRPFFPAEPPAAFLRLSFAGAGDEREIEEGVRRLARAIRAGPSRSLD